MVCNQAFAGSIGVKVESNQDCVNVEGNRITGFDIGIVGTNADSFTARRNSINAVTTAISAAFGEDNEVGPNFIEKGTPLALPGGMPPGLRYHAKGATTLTLSGCTTTPQGLVTWVAKDGEVTLTFPVIEGTSNSKAATLGTLPSEIRPASAKRTELARVKDNETIAVGLVEVASNGTINLLPTVAGGRFTASGTKGIGSCSVRYLI